MPTIQNLRKSLVRNCWPVCSLVWGAMSGAEFAPFPSPLPPASSRAGQVCSQLALLWSCTVPLFCNRPAVCSGRLVFSLSLAIPQLKLLSHESSVQLHSGHSVLVLTLSSAACSSPFCPHLLVAKVGVWGTSAGSCFYAPNLCILFIFLPS